MLFQAACNTSGGSQPISRSTGENQRVERMVSLGCDGFRFPRGRTAAQDYDSGSSGGSKAIDGYARCRHVILDIPHADTGNG